VAARHAQLRPVEEHATFGEGRIHLVAADVRHAWLRRGTRGESEQEKTRGY